MKHITIITLLALITLFAGCNPHFNTENESVSGGEIARVQVDIGGNARTILPDLNNGFSKYVLSAESIGGTQNAPVPVELIDTRYGYIHLPYGDWIITATAYVDVGGTDYAAARGSASLTVEDSYHYISIAVNAPEPGGTGTFNYTVRYPASGTASIKLEPWPLGQAAVVNENINGGYGNGSPNVASGVYFLTVTATANSRTVTRNDIVHIYAAQSPTNVDYVFTKLDFGDSSLNLSGTVKILVNGIQPNRVYLSFSTDTNSSRWHIPIDFTGNDDGTCTWEMSLSDLGGAATLYFWAGHSDYMNKELPSMAIPVDDVAGIDLGTVDFTVEPLPAGNTWADGETTTGDAEHFYSLDVTEGTTYYFWLNNYNGDGTKTLRGYFTAFYSDGYSIFGYDNAWHDPMSFIAANDTVYIKVGGGDYTGTYAIVYNTNGDKPDYPFTPPNPTPLAIDTWFDGEITTPYTRDWYSIDVTAGTYYLWRNDWSHGNGKTLTVDIFAYSSDGELLFESYYSWEAPVVFTAEHSDTVYLRVRTRYGYPETGTYAIMYSDRPRINVGVEIRTAFEQNNHINLYYNSEVNQGNELGARIEHSTWWASNYNPVLSYSWYIDGVLQEGEDYTNSQVSLPTTGLSPGMHYGLAVITIDGADFSREFSFRVYGY